jgi:hypothetical protein
MLSHLSELPQVNKQKNDAAQTPRHLQACCRESGSKPWEKESGGYEAFEEGAFLSHSRLQPNRDLWVEESLVRTRSSLMSAHSFRFPTLQFVDQAVTGFSPW